MQLMHSLLCSTQCGCSRGLDALRHALSGLTLVDAALTCKAWLLVALPAANVEAAACTDDSFHICGSTYVEAVICAQHELGGLSPCNEGRLVVPSTEMPWSFDSVVFKCF